MELEELAVKPVAQRAGPRIGVAGGVAVVALVGVLAGGLGFLGGRAEPSPRPSGTATEGAVAPPTPASSQSAGTPLETPWMACQPAAEELAVIELQSNGVRTPGLTELAAGPEPTPTVTPGNPFASIKGLRVEVRPDVVNEVWIDGGACALEWSIEVVDHRTEGAWVLHEVQNPTRDPNVAAQNRFNLSHELAPLRSLGADVQLRGVFFFSTSVVRASWRLRILPLDRPVPRLRVPEPNPRRLNLLVEGCDTALRLGNGYVELLECEDDLSAELGEPEDPETVRPGDVIALQLEGWTVTSWQVACGYLSGLSFVAERQPVPGCEAGPDPGTFRVPTASGRWTLALAACATQTDSPDANQVCGTWYAAVRVRE